jgi:hypothetical protein
VAKDTKVTKVTKEAKKATSGSKKKDPVAVKATPVPTGRWSEEPQEHDYPAAASFLSLISEPTEVRKLVTALKAAPIVRHQAKDLLRASGLALLPADNAHVASDLAKISRGERLSPVLLVRGDMRRAVNLVIADGYHRICASYHVDENADIPCHLVDHKGPSPVPAFRQRTTANSGAGSRAAGPAPAPAPTASPPAAPAVDPAPAEVAAPAPASVSTVPPQGAPTPAPGSAAGSEPSPGSGWTAGPGSVPSDQEGHVAQGDR